MDQNPALVIIAKHLHDQPQWMLGGQVVLLPIAQQHLFQTHLRSAISDLADKMIMVGYDWMGRPIGLCNQENNTVLLYDSIFDELMEFELLDGQLASSPFLDPILDNFGREEYISFVTRLHMPRIEFGFCAGYTIPPQLGGAVLSSNMELYEISTYWHYTSILHHALADLPVGTILKSLRIE